MRSWKVYEKELVLKNRIHFFKTNNGADLSIYEDDFFDFCFLVATFQYFPNKKVIENYFKEIARILKKGLFKIRLDGRKWVASRFPIPIYRPLCITSCVIPYF
ncbi:MAG TPA: methyltransferase domain-containing protein [Candidatus Atribacteria bacterium]|nr:methyltransferase domain-containing protein [Candidatus Atribacteria bacterium]